MAGNQQEWGGGDMEGPLSPQWGFPPILPMVIFKIIYFLSFFIFLSQADRAEAVAASGRSHTIAEDLATLCVGPTS